MAIFSLDNSLSFGVYIYIQNILQKCSKLLIINFRFGNVDKKQHDCMCKVHTCEQCFHPLTQSKKDNFQYDNTKSIVGVTHKQSSEIKKKEILQLTYQYLKLSTYYLSMLQVMNGELNTKHSYFIQGHTSISIKNHCIKSSKFHVYNFAYTKTKELEFTGKEQNRIYWYI